MIWWVILGFSSGVVIGFLIGIWFCDHITNKVFRAKGYKGHPWL